MFKNITLEVSLKPFKNHEESAIRSVCQGIFRQWYPLLKNREEISIMMWTSDGSEILDYKGNPEDEFEWCCYVGTANNPLADENDRPDLCLHEKKRYYMENPSRITYGTLKQIVSILKEEGKKAFPNAAITVGETFDIGPEFAYSDFKSNRHTEITTGDKVGSCNCGFIDSTAYLKQDDYPYASYPNGIPEHTPFGLFLGKQSQIFLKDMGFDYLWLSNGLGFSANPWSLDGKIFDGKQFHPERLEKTKADVFEFWKQFREGCPDYPLETRGTNNSVGIDYATDGVPLYDIYRGGFDITPPPNSPWAALNDDFGLEIMGHMTRICELPGENFLFRYYIHDPWWINSPWYDRYDSQPHDIYLPMAVSRIDENGKTQSAEMLNILSIDNSYGDMPDCCVNEPLPHLLKAEKNASDEPAPFVWVYPMREYTTSADSKLLETMYYGDRFICDAINSGFPLNCVVSTDIFLKTGIETYQKSTLISPIPVEVKVKEKLENLIQHGLSVVCYGEKEEQNKAPAGSVFAAIEEGPQALMKAIGQLGYLFEYDKADENVKVLTTTIARYDNGLWFAVYNANTTTKTKMRFPLGAPVLMCGETKIENGYSTYYFNRSEYRECRLFVQQKSGVISVREEPPVNAAIRRRVSVRGLEDATVCFFPESECCEYAAAQADLRYGTPEYDPRWKIVKDPTYGTYMKAEHVSGEIICLMPRREQENYYRAFYEKNGN